jgi:hypothetical protein
MGQFGFEVFYRPKTCNVRSMFQKLYTHNLRLRLNRETPGLFAKVLHKERASGAPCSLPKGMVSRDEYYFEGP